MPVLKNPKHEAFAQARAQGKSASEAYRIAGYKPDRGAAARLSANVSVKKRLAELTGKSAERAEVTVAQVLRELSRVGFADIRKAFDGSGNLLHPDDWPDELASAVASIEVVTRSLPGGADTEFDGQPHGGALKRRRRAKVEYVHKIRFWDKNAALEKIAKYLGMFVDRHELTGKDGAPIEEVVTHKLDKASAQVIADLIK